MIGWARTTPFRISTERRRDTQHKLGAVWSIGVVRVRRQSSRCSPNLVLPPGTDAMKCDEDVKWFLLPTPLHGTDVVRCMLVGRWPRHNAREAPIWCISGQIGHATAPPAAGTNGPPRVRCLNGAHQAHREAHFRGKKRLRAPGRRAGRVVTRQGTARFARFGVVAPRAGGSTTWPGPMWVLARSFTPMSPAWGHWVGGGVHMWACAQPNS